MRWSRPDIYNSTCNCARHMTLAGKTLYNAMIHIMDYSVITPERGLVLKPYGNWDGISTDYEFKVTVKTDSDYTKCLDTRRSVTESVVYLNEVPITFRSSTQKTVSLLTNKAKLNAAVVGVQYALFLQNILKSIRLKVELHILASIDYGGAVDIGNNWNVGGRMH